MAKLQRSCCRTLSLIAIGTVLWYIIVHINFLQYLISPSIISNYPQNNACTCFRHNLPPQLSTTYRAEISQSLCSDYSTQRGPHQRVIAISLFGPKENKIFQLNRTLTFLAELIKDLNLIYPDNFILRVYHDDTISKADVVCPIECQNHNVDFCSVDGKHFIPPKIWRFIPAGDPLVDIMMSRDLDSAFTRRERAAVDAWFASNKSFHAMRDHPMHGVPMLGGMWGFRPSLNRELSRIIHDKIHNKTLVSGYGGRGDQTFLSNEVWPHAKTSIIVHDSFLCKNGYGQTPVAFPTQRSSANETNCFVGCVRPCCGKGKMPFGECPVQCRPPDHQDWLYC